MSRLVLLIALLLQLTPQIHWKSEVKEAPEGNQIVLTGDLDPEIDHVSGTVTYMPCAGDACYMPVDWDFDMYVELTSGSEEAGAAVPSGNLATLGTVRGGTASEAQRWGPKDVSGGWLTCSDVDVAATPRNEAEAIAPAARAAESKEGKSVVSA